MPRPRTFESAMAFLGDPDQEIIRAYVAELETALEVQTRAAFLIDAWNRVNGKPAPWRVAVQIISIVDHLHPEETARLLALEQT